MNNSMPMQLQAPFKLPPPNFLRNMLRHNSFTQNNLQIQEYHYITSNYEINHPQLFRQQSMQEEDQQYKTFIQEYKGIEQINNHPKKKSKVHKQKEQRKVQISPSIVFYNEPQNLNDEFEIQSVQSVQGNINNKNEGSVNNSILIFKGNNKELKNKQKLKKSIRNIFQLLKKQLDILKYQIKTENLHNLDIISQNIKALQQINSKKYPKIQQKQFIKNNFEQIKEQQMEETAIQHKQESFFFSTINQYKKTMQNNRKIINQKNNQIFALQSKQEVLRKEKESLENELKNIKQQNELLNFEIKSYLNEYQLDKTKYQSTIQNLKKKYQDEQIYIKDNYVRQLEMKQNKISELTKLVDKYNLEIQSLKKNSQKSNQISTLNQNIKILQQTNNTLLENLQSLKYDKDTLIQTYEKKINEVTQESYIIYEQNFGLLQKIQSFDAQLEQKMEEVKKQLRRQYRQKIKDLTNQVLSLKVQLKNKESQSENYEKLLTENKNALQNLNKKIRNLSEKQKYLQQYYYANEKKKQQCAESMISNNSDIHLSNGRPSEHQPIRNIKIGSQKKSDKYNDFRSDKMAGDFKQSMVSQQQGIYKRQVENFKKSLNNSRLQKNLQDVNKKNNYPNKIGNYYQNADYREIQQKYTILDKSRQKQLYYPSYELKPSSNSRTIIRDSSKYSRSNFNNKNESKVHHRKDSSASKKVQYNRLEFQLQNLSKQLKNELLQFGRKKF